jgi:signal transduction histidine kinase
MVAAKDGKRLMDRIRAGLAAFDAEEAELLAHRQAEAAGLRSGLLALIAAALLAAAALAVLVAIASRRNDRRLREANERLEFRVEERTRSLSESEARLRLAQEVGGIGLWDWDVRADRITFIGTAFQRWGIDTAELQPNIGGFMRALHPDDRPHFEAAIDAALKGERSLDAEFRVTGRDGQVRTLASRAEVYRDHTGPYRMLGVNLDVTDRRAATDALAELNEELETRVRERTAALEEEATRRVEAEAQLRQSQKMEAVGQLTGGVAHDFNNLLTVIIGGLDRVQRRIESDADPADAALREALRRPIAMALQSAHSAAQLTHRLLAFSRRQPLEPKVLEVNKLVTGLSEMLRRTLGEAVEVETVLSGGLWATFADANQLENALLNLVVNARDAMPSGGRLTIETANAYLDEKYVAALDDVPPGQYVMLSVTDTGSGMPRDVLDHAFEPFFTTKDTGKGSGLGLPMVYGFVKQSGGHIRIYSEMAHGTTVKIYLPRYAQAERDMSPPAPPPSPATEPLPGGGETILLVEDNEVVRQYGSSVLRELGYRVIEAEDAASALAVLDDPAQPAISLLFTDVILPGGASGRELADQARARRPLLPVLFTTGYTRNAIVHHGRLDPNVSLIGKPFTQESLAKKVREVLDAARANANVVVLKPGRDSG